MKKALVSKLESSVDLTAVTPVPASKVQPKEYPASGAKIESEDVRKLLSRIKEEGKVGPKFFEWLGSR